MVIIDGHKISPNKKIIDDLKLQIVYMPLESSFGYSYKPCVKVGDYVRIGEFLGVNKIADLPLMSSVSGTVVGLEDKYISNGKIVKCIVIENDFKERYKNKPGKKRDITKYSKDEFIYMLRENGIAGLSGSDYPTYLKYDTKNKLKYLIVNGIECEIYSSCDNALMYHYTEEILEGIDAIVEIMGLEKAYIAINESNSKIIKKFLKYINTYPNIKVFSISDGYPSGWDKNLISEILGKNYKNSADEVGVVVNNVSTIYSIYEMLKYNRPLSERIVTITGNGIKRPGNYKVKIGTNFSEIILKTEGYTKVANPVLIAGGGMMGKSIPNDELIITKDLSTIVVTTLEETKESPCIKCGKCGEVCPVGLMPAVILENANKSKKLHIDKCIECGLCSYVCPSKIEVREKLKELKEKR